MSWLQKKASIPKSKDPSDIVTAIETTHTTEEATVHVCGLDIFIQVQLLKESPRGTLAGKLCEAKEVTGQPSYLIITENLPSML